MAAMSIVGWVETALSSKPKHEGARPGTVGAAFLPIAAMGRSYGTA